MDLPLRVRHCERRLSALEREVAALRDGAVAAPPPPVPAPWREPPVVVPEAASVLSAIPSRDVGTPAPPVESVAPPPPSVPPASLGRTRGAGRGPSPARPPRTLEDLERVFGVAVLGRIGVAALLLAAAYFAQLAYRHIGPVERVVSIYGLSALLVGAGFWSRRRVAVPYVAILWGGGVAAAYLAGVVARLRYDLVAWPVALGMLAGACVLGQALAAVARTRALATVALLGAFAAPLLVGIEGDPRTVLLVYLLGLHAFAAHLEARWKWQGVRLLGVVGTLVVACVWASRHAGVDASTYLHVHLYLAGLLLPEAVAAWKGRSLSAAGAVALLAAWAVEAPLLVLSLARDRVTGFALLAGVAFTATAFVLSLRRTPPAVFGRTTARLGLVLLVLGAALAWAPFEAGRAFEARVLLSLAGAAVVAVAACRRLGTGEGAAVLASVLSTLWLVSGDHPSALTPIGMIPAAAVFGFGRAAPARIAAVVLGIGALFAGLVPARWTGGAEESLALAFVASAAVAVVVRFLSARRSDVATARAVEPILAVLAVGWALVAFRGPFRDVPVALGNPGTVAAIALAGAFALARPWRPAASGSEDFRVVSAAGLLGVCALAIWREADAWAVRDLAPVWVGVARTALAAGLATAAAAIGRRARAEGLAVCAAVAFAGATAWAFHAAAGAPSLVQAAHVVALAAGGLAVASLSSPPLRASVGLGLLSTALLWGRFLFRDATEAGFAVVNERLLSAAVVAAALVVASLRVGTRTAPAAAMRIGAACLVYLAGLDEVRDAVSSLDLEWRRAWASVYSTVAAAAVLATGFRTRLPDLRWTALAGFGAVILKVGLLDLAMLETPYRILVTAVLGGVLLLAAYTYARRSARTAGGSLDDASPPAPGPLPAPTLPSLP